MSTYTFTHTKSDDTKCTHTIEADDLAAALEQYRKELKEEDASE